MKLGTKPVTGLKLGTANISRAYLGSALVWEAGGDPGGFSPADLSGLQLWLDADDAATITTDSGAVTAWNDKSPNAIPFAPGISTTRPALVAAAHAGRSAIRFDGSNDRLTAGSNPLLRNAPGATLYAVAQPHSQGTSTRQVVFIKVPGANEPRMTIARTAGMSGQHQSFYRKLDGDSNTFFSSGVTWSVNALACVGTLLDWDAATRTMRVDGVQRVHTTGLGTSGTFSDTDADAIYIGMHASGGTALFWHGDICEVIAYGRALNSMEIALLEAYLLTKWGL